MMRVVMSGAIIVLTLVLTVASSGIVLCETDCAANAHAAAADTSMNDRFGHDAASHCGGGQTDSARHNSSTPNRNSSRNTKHTGVHLHPRIVATATAEIQISTPLKFSASVAILAGFDAAICARSVKTLWNDSSPPPINSPSAFSTGVLRF
jgi:hypothetical protein